MAQAASQSSAAPPDESPTSTLSAAADPFCPVDPCKLQTVVLADHAHVLLTLDSSYPPVYSLPSAKLQTGADLSRCLRECVASTLGVFPSSFGDVGSHRHTTLVDNACVHHVFVPPARFPLHRLRHVMNSMIQCCSSSRPPRPVVLVPWSQLDEPSIILDSHARSLTSMLRPHLDKLQRKIRLPVCALISRCETDSGSSQSRISGTQGGAPGTQGGGTEDSVPLCTTPGTQGTGSSCFRLIPPTLGLVLSENQSLG